MDDAMAERAKVVAMIRREEKIANAGHSRSELYCGRILLALADAIERGDDDTIAIPRLSDDQGAG